MASSDEDIELTVAVHFLLERGRTGYDNQGSQYHDRYAWP